MERFSLIGPFTAFFRLRMAFFVYKCISYAAAFTNARAFARSWFIGSDKRFSGDRRRLYIAPSRKCGTNSPGASSDPFRGDFSCARYGVCIRELLVAEGSYSKPSADRRFFLCFLIELKEKAAFLGEQVPSFHFCLLFDGSAKIKPFARTSDRSSRPARSGRRAFS